MCFNGFYVSLERYIREGALIPGEMIPKTFICQYFKYLKFHSDGLVLYFNCNKRLPVRLIEIILSKDYYRYTLGEVGIKELSEILTTPPNG